MGKTCSFSRPTYVVYDHSLPKVDGIRFCDKKRPYTPSSTLSSFTTRLEIFPVFSRTDVRRSAVVDYLGVKSWHRSYSVTNVNWVDDSGMDSDSRSLSRRISESVLGLGRGTVELTVGGNPSH